MSLHEIQHQHYRRLSPKNTLQQLLKAAQKEQHGL